MSPPSLPSIIIDCGTTNHFIPDCNSFINYVELTPVSIQTANSYIFSAIGKGNMKTLLPIGNKTLPTPITLKNIYYLPSILFTLISATCMT